MFGLIGKMTASAGQREKLVSILKESSVKMSGCHSYIVALDNTDNDSIWITEVWDNPESHKNSLKIPAVIEAISKARPIIANMGPFYETTPVTGIV